LLSPLSPLKESERLLTVWELEDESLLLDSKIHRILDIEINIPKRSSIRSKLLDNVWILGDPRLGIMKPFHDFT